MQNIHITFIFLICLALYAADPTPIDCQYEWSLWSRCDAGPCDAGGSGTRYKKDRYLEIRKPPQFGGKSCDKTIGISANEINDRVQEDLCTPAEQSAAVCYETDYCLPERNFSCTKGRECLSPSLRCNGEVDCEDGSDEQSCQGNPTFNCNYSAEIKNIHKMEQGILGIDLGLTSNVLSNKYYGTCIQQTLNGIRYRISPNIDNYDQIPSVQDIFKSTKFYNFKQLFEYVLSQMYTDVIRDDLYKFLSKITFDKPVEFHEARIMRAQDKVLYRTAEQLELKGDFEMRLRRLPTELSFRKYFELFGQFGSHSFSEASRGGNVLAIKVVEIFCESTQRRTIRSGRIPNWLKDQNTTSHPFFIMIEGGDSSKANALRSHFSDANLLAWSNTLLANPAIIMHRSGDHSYKLRPLQDLLTSRYLSLHNKDQIRQVMDDGIKAFMQPFDTRLCTPCTRPDEQLLMAYDDTQAGRVGHYGCYCIPSNFSDYNCVAAPTTASGAASTTSSGEPVKLHGIVLVMMMVISSFLKNNYF